MATKKKTKKKSTHSKKATGKKAAATKKQAQKKKASKKLANRKAAPTKAAAKTEVSKKAIRAKTAGTSSREPRRRIQGQDPAFSRDTLGSRSGGQSGDLQGLSDVEGADSESVEELIEEGNAFEAGVVTGVEDAGNRGVREVHTREVPEDDVPGEYLDED